MTGDSSTPESDETAVNSLRDSPHLNEELDQTFRTLYALLKRRDQIVDETGDRPLEKYGLIIQTAGAIRDQIPADEVPRAEDIDPDEVFRS